MRCRVVRWFGIKKYGRTTTLEPKMATRDDDDDGDDDADGGDDDDR